VAVCRAALGWYQIGVEGGLYTASRDIPASGLLLGIAERPEVVLDFGDAPLGCVFELRNNAPVPFTGIYPAPELDTAPLPELIQFKVARAADSGRDAAKGWELAGGLSAPGSSAAQRRQVVDSALMLQNGGIAEGLRTNLLLAAIDAAEPPVPPSPSVVHQPASPQLAAALTALDALPPCAMSAADANDDALLHPPLCLRRTVLFEQMACPAALPSPGGGIPPLPLIGPLAGAPTYGPEGVRCANPDPAGRCPNTAETYINSDYATCEPMVPLRVLLGTASIDADGRIAPFVPPEGYESPPTEYVGQRVDPVTGQLIRQEVWDFINWSVDAHPMHVHEASLRVLGRYVVPILPDQDGGVDGYVDQDSELDCANAYWGSFARNGYGGLLARADASALYLRYCRAGGVARAARGEGRHAGQPQPGVCRAGPGASVQPDGHLPARQPDDVRAVCGGECAPLRAIHRVVPPQVRAADARAVRLRGLPRALRVALPPAGARGQRHDAPAAHLRAARLQGAGRGGRRLPAPQVHLPRHRRRVRRPERLFRHLERRRGATREERV
jgi:hypothetical protein